MRDRDKTKEQLIEEVTTLRQRVRELEAVVSTRSSVEQVFYQNILDRTVAGFFQISPERQYLVVNSVMAEILGYDSPLEMTDSVTNIAQQIYVHPQQYYDFESLLAERGKVEEFEYQAHCKDGRTIWLSDSASAVRDRDGTILYYEGNSIDITERKVSEVELQRAVEERTAALEESNDFLVEEVVEHRRAKTALRATKDQLKAILDTIPGIVSCISSDLRYLGVNRQLAQIFNRSPQDFIGQDLGFLSAGSEFSSFVREFFASSEREAGREIAAQVNGDRRHYLIVAKKYANNQAAFTVGVDVTARRKAEQNLKVAKDQLQAVLEAVPGIVSWIRSDLRYLGVNRQLANLYNIRPEAFVGQDIGFLGTGSEFNNFVKEFFESPYPETTREVSAQVKGKKQDYLIVAQKYDRDRAAFIVGIEITARKQAEKTLRETQAKYQSIVENAVEGIFQIQPNGRYLKVNPALARIYGYESPAALMDDINQSQVYIQPQHSEQFIQLLETHDRVVGFETQIHRRDGKTTWISENARAVRDEQGNLLYYEGTVEDITERKRAEAELQRAYEELEMRVEERTAALKHTNEQLIVEISERTRIEQALRTSEAELRALFAAMTDIITVFDAQGRYVKAVSTNSEVLHSPTENRIGKSVYEVLPPEEADFFVAEIQRVLNTGQTVNLEYSLRVDAQRVHTAGNGQRFGAQSEEIWFAATVSPMPDNCAIWVARNITERKRMLDSLSEAEAKYRSIFENAAEGIFQISPDGRFLSANPAFVKMYGYASAEELMAEVADIDRQLYVDRDRRAELIATLERQDFVSHAESQIYRKDRSIIWISENIRAVRDPQGQLLYYEGTVDDITQRKQAEEALRLEQERAERLLLNVLPKAIADQLKQYQESLADVSEPADESQANTLNRSFLAERFDEATVLFADIVGFTPLSARISPLELVSLLNQIFSSFDKLADKYGLEKIKTIGDAYMVAGGLPVPHSDRDGAIAEMALEMQQEISRFQSSDRPPFFQEAKDKISPGDPFQIRIGINTGPVVAGVIGIKKFIYDLWGDTVNVASRMESQGEGGKIQVTSQTYERLKDRYQFEKRGRIFVKGKGEMVSYWLTGRKL